MKYLKIFIVAVAIGTVAIACQVDSGEDCYRCTASDPNGVGTAVSDDLCGTDLTEAQKESFQQSFEAQHDPASYNISCEDI